MSYAAAVDSLASRIESLVPAWDPDYRFQCVETGDHGAGASLEECPDDVSRLFDIRLASLPADDGGSGFVTTRWVVGLELRVRYAHTSDRARLERAMAFDASQLATALIHPSLPSAWHSSIDTVEPPSPPTLAPIAGPEGRPIAWILTMAFVLHYTYTPDITGAG
jgi:hypothetical protein